MVSKMVRRMKIRTYRITTQFLIFVALNMGLVIGFYGFPAPVFYCYASPFATSLCPIGAIEYAVIVAPALLTYIFGVLILFGAIFGRGMCGWACPIGALEDIISLKSKFKTSVRMDKYKIRWLKYFILLIIPILSYIYGAKVFTDICPIGGLTATVPTLLLNPYGYRPIQPFFTIKMILTVLFMVLIVLIARGWCKYFCPLGACFAVFNRVSLVAIKYDGGQCMDCTVPLCAKECPMNLVPKSDVNSKECIRCGRCVDACPTNALHYTLRISSVSIQRAEEPEDVS